MILIGENKLKNDFQDYFIQKMKDLDFIYFFYNVFTFGTAYIVGGFFRDFINGKSSRDVDIIVDINNEILGEILNELELSYSINRHGGIKIKLSGLEVDVWSFENNWAFKNKLVKLNEDDKLNSIAKGCFYNYDSLVINLNNFNYNLRYYKEFVETRKLNILQERTLYKNLNPSIEANILRAFYIKHLYGISFSPNTTNYLTSKIGHLWDKYGDPIDRLLKIRESYSKYSVLERNIIVKYLQELKNESSSLPSLFDY
jgi:hypothetical protein